MPESTTKVQCLTSQTPAAIAALAVTGPEAFEIVIQRLRSSSGGRLNLVPGEARFAQWQFQDCALSAEHVVVLARDPGCVEINCHGGVAITQAIIQDLIVAGCGQVQEPLDRGLEDECTPAGIELAARMALARASTLKVASLLLDQQQGALWRAMEELRVAIERSELAKAEMLRSQLLARSKLGLKLVDPWRVTLAGPPNVGKSSLLNALFGSSRVLVHDQPGTTRDAVDASIVVADWPLILTDTAGIRSTNETVERLGVLASRQRWAATDIGLLVVDAVVGWTDLHAELLELRGDQLCLVVLNKADCLPEGEDRRLRARIGQQTGRTVVCTSALSATGIDPLLNALGSLLDEQMPPDGAAIPFTTRQIEAIRLA